MSTQLIKSCGLNIYIAGTRNYYRKAFATVHDSCDSCSAIVRNWDNWIVVGMRRNVFSTCLAKMIPTKPKDNPTGGLTRGEKGWKKATPKVAATRERSGELSMHCVIARVYPLYYARPPPLLVCYTLSNYIQRKRFSAGWFLAITWPLSTAFLFSLSLSLSLLSLFLSLLLLRSYLIYSLSFMRTRYTAGYLRECDSGFTYADDGGTSRTR